MTDNCRNFSLDAVHVEGAARIAESAAKYDVDRLIHLSSYNADPASASEFYASKVSTPFASRKVHYIGS